MGERPLILVTNDDGIDSPALQSLARAAASLGDVLVVAPTEQQTSLGRAYPKVDGCGTITERTIETGGGAPLRAYAVKGSPAFVVSYAMLELCPRKPNLCLSGVNYGENVGLSCIASGTIGAALEANTYDVPAIAISCEVSIEHQHGTSFPPINGDLSNSVTLEIARRVLARGLGSKTALLNVNIPRTATNGTRRVITFQSRQNYFVFRKPNRESFDNACKLPVEIEIDERALEKGSDIDVFVRRREISITPLTWDMTASKDRANYSDIGRIERGWW